MSDDEDRPPPLKVEVIGDPARLTEMVEAVGDFGSFESVARMLEAILPTVMPSPDPGEIAPTRAAQRIRGAIARHIGEHPRHEDPLRAEIARRLAMVDADGVPSHAFRDAVRFEGVRLGLAESPQGNVWRGICFDVRETRGLPDPE